MAQGDKLRQMIAARYDNDGVRHAVYDDAVKHGTVEKIESGELSLPHPHDAHTFYLRSIGQENVSAKEREQADQIKALEARLATLEQHVTAPAPRASQE